MQRIGERLVEVRRASGLGVRGFAAGIARAVGYEISHTSVANYESGTTVPAAYAVAVSRTFSVGLPWLLTGEGLPNEVGQPELENAFRRIAAIVSEALPGLRGVEGDQDSFFRSSPDLFVILDRNGDIVRANPAWEALLGKPVRDLERTPFSAIVHEDSRTALEQLLTLDDSGPESAELRVKSVAHDWLPISLRVSHVGGLAYGVGRWSLPRRERSNWLHIVQEVLQDASDLYVLFDDEARCLAVNRAAARALRLAPPSIVGMSLIEVIFRPTDRESARVVLKQFLDAGQFARDLVLPGEGPTPMQFHGRLVANVEPGVHLGVAYARQAQANLATRLGAGSKSS